MNLSPAQFDDPTARLARDSRDCDRCGRRTVPRGERVARYCAVCGATLDGARPRRGRDTTGGTTPAATAAMALAVLSMIPLIGVFASVAAIVMATIAKRQIAESPRPLRGLGMANAAIGLSLLTAGFWFLACLGVRVA